MWKSIHTITQGYLQRMRSCSSAFTFSIWFASPCLLKWRFVSLLESAKKSSGQEKWKQMKDLQLLHFCWCGVSRRRRRIGRDSRETNSILSRLAFWYCQGFYRSLAIGERERWCERDRETNKFPTLLLALHCFGYYWCVCILFEEKKVPWEPWQNWIWVLIDVFDWCQKFSSEIPKGPYFTMKATMSTANPRHTKCHLGFVHARIYSPEYFPSTGQILVLV